MKIAWPIVAILIREIPNKIVKIIIKKVHTNHFNWVKGCLRMSKYTRSPVCWFAKRIDGRTQREDRYFALLGVWGVILLSTMTIISHQPKWVPLSYPSASLLHIYQAKLANIYEKHTKKMPWQRPIFPSPNWAIVLLALICFTTLFEMRRGGTKSLQSPEQLYYNANKKKNQPPLVVMGQKTSIKVWGWVVRC